MTQSLRIASWIVTASIVVASIIRFAMGAKELVGSILSLAILCVWSPMLTMKVAMIRVRARARLLRRPVSRLDTGIALVGSLIVGPILGFFSFAFLGAFASSH